MRQRTLLTVGVLVFVAAFISCSAKPEQSLLKGYFNALKLNDNATLSSMALEPISLEVDNWSVTKTEPEKIVPANLAELGVQEAEAKKALERHVGPTMDAKDALDMAQEDFDTARTGAAKAAAKKKIDELQVKYDQEYNVHKDLQKAYNDAKAAAAGEEEITRFSLGNRDLANVRDLTGNVHSKTIEIAVKNKAGETRSFSLELRRYQLRDEALGLNHNGRWVIIRFEPIGG
jgi:hypothetical protein